MSIKERRRARIAIILFILIAAISVCVFAAENCPENGVYLSDGGKSELKSAAPVSGNITNLVIFICFSDENVNSVKSTVTPTLINYYVGGSVSLKDYYYTETYGKITIDTLFPRDNNAYFVYKAPKSRTHYRSITSKTLASTRMREESTLLNGAVEAADRYFDYGDAELDADGDGFADSVSFLASGTYDSSDSSAWGGLLWPHSANLNEYTEASGGTAATLNGLKISDFSFNFIQTVDVGLICHEMGHVLGMPDLYHYNRDTNYISVGTWDLMHAQNATPQYSLVYIRDRYLKAIGEMQIADISSDGVYSLKSVAEADKDEIIAYKIKINDNESIWMEYRDNTASSYDSMLPNSGLIVYRVNTSVSGNENGGHNKEKFPDEVYIFRPSAHNDVDLRTRENNNLKYAAMSADNPYFSELGGTEIGDNYNSLAIYTGDGRNTGIRIEIVGEANGLINFKVDANGYGSEEGDNLYVVGDAVTEYGQEPQITVKFRKDGEEYVTLNKSQYSLIYDSEKIGEQTATVVYATESGEELRRSFRLTIKDTIEKNGISIERYPYKTAVNAGQNPDLSGLKLKIKYLSGRETTVVYSENNARDFIIEGVDISVGGLYNMKITYTPLDISVYIEFSVLTELKAIRVSEKNTTTVFDIQKSPVLNVEGVYEDGTVRILNADEYTVSSFNATADSKYKAQTVRITSREKPSLVCTKTIFAVDFSELEKVERLANPKTVYRYGEALDLSDGRLKMVFNGGFDITVPAENYFSAYDNVFSAVKRGAQTLTAFFGSLTDVLNVTVLAPDNNILTTQTDDKINTTAGYVLLNKSMKLSEAEEVFRSYLGIRFIKKDGNTEYEVSSGAYPEAYLSSQMRIELTNGDGRAVMKFAIYVVGDADGDGTADKNDLPFWADMLLKNANVNIIYLDMNGDGVYTLTDFVILSERYGK